MQHVCSERHVITAVRARLVDAALVVEAERNCLVQTQDEDALLDEVEACPVVFVCVGKCLF